MYSHYGRHFQVLPPFKYGGARGSTERKTEYVSHRYSAELDQTRTVWVCIPMVSMDAFGALFYWDHPTIPRSHLDLFCTRFICAPVYLQEAKLSKSRRIMPGGFSYSNASEAKEKLKIKYTVNSGAYLRAKTPLYSHVSIWK